MWTFVVVPVRAWITTVAAAGVAAVAILVGWTAAVLAGVAVAGACVVWSRRFPGSWWHWWAGPVVEAWRRWWRYERRWTIGLTGCDLAARVDGVTLVPRLRRVRCERWVDRLTVALLPGQSPDDVAVRAQELAHTFGAWSCRVRLRGPGSVVVELVHGDPLARPLPALNPPEVVDLMAVPVGRREDGRPWTVRLLGTHVLVAGVTGSGKSSAVWSLLRGLAPAIRDGSVLVWAVDPKGGMELSLGRPLFARLAVDAAEAGDLLEDAAAFLRARAARLAGLVRQHRPTPQDPLLLVLVDEVATLTAYLGERDLQRRIEAALSVLLSQGRAVGVSVVGALQDPRKEVLRFRNLFPTKIALRLDEPAQVDMVLGDDARRQGARADQIPQTQPGIGYVRVDGQPEPVRVRAAYVGDDDIRALAADYACPASTGQRTAPVVTVVPAGEAP